MTDVHDLSYYLKCMGGGVLACGLTHCAVTPLDIVKCRRQVDPTLYSSLGNGLKTIYANEGLRGITLGAEAALVGYSLQGFGKFGFYEIFKDVYKKLVGPANAARYQSVGFAISSACAEVIADCLLCPMEAVKVRQQTSRPGTYPSGIVAATSEMAKEGTAGFYKGLYPLMARQVPYTIVKFVSFENTVRFVYRNFLTRDKNSYSKATRLGVTFLSGYWAGIFCAIVSHPADTLVSKINRIKDVEGEPKLGVVDKSKKIYAEIGFRGLWNGLATRILMVGTLTGLQWWIYDSFKTATGLQPS